MKALTSEDDGKTGAAGRAAGPTIYEVASRAGVSIATVSRVLRGTSPVTAETRQRVQRAVEELRFTPSRLGRSLAEGRHVANGIVFPDLAGPYFAEVLMGYEEVAAEVGRSVLVLTTHGRAATRERVLDLASRVDGMVMVARTVADDVVAELDSRRVPLVLVARPAPPDARRVDVIRTDNQAGAAALTTHLLADGHRRFAFLGAPDESPDVAERWHGMVARLQAADVEPPAAPVPCGFEEAAGFAATRQLLAAPRGGDLPDVLVCANDEIALGAVLAAEQLGRRVPEDIAITGWDDIMAARYARPGLTTVRQPMRELGVRAARRLHERVEGDLADARSDLLPTALVVRQSCGRHDGRTQQP